MQTISRRCGRRSESSSDCVERDLNVISRHRRTAPRRLTGRVFASGYAYLTKLSLCGWRLQPRNAAAFGVHRNNGSEPVAVWTYHARTTASNMLACGCYQYRVGPHKAHDGCLARTSLLQCCGRRTMSSMMSRTPGTRVQT